jgi:hypothetical protein
MRSTPSSPTLPKGREPLFDLITDNRAPRPRFVCMRTLAVEIVIESDTFGHHVRQREASRVIAETRQYLDDADALLRKNNTAPDFFKAMLKRYPNRRLDATTLWAGTRSLYAQRDGRGAEASLAGWL